MTPAYVLILTVFGLWADSVGTVDHIEGFTTPQACSIAGNVWLAQMRESRSKIRYTAVCVRTQ